MLDAAWALLGYFVRGAPRYISIFCILILFACSTLLIRFALVLAAMAGGGPGAGMAIPLFIMALPLIVDIVLVFLYLWLERHPRYYLPIFFVFVGFGTYVDHRYGFDLVVDDIRVVLGGNRPVGKPTGSAGRALWKKADKGDAAAQAALGDYFYEGKETFGLKNSPWAKEWYLKAEKGGNAHAETMLGVIYGEDWRGPSPVERDPVESFKYFDKAAAHGDALGQFYLGRCYEFGLGVKKDIESAKASYEKAAGQGLPKGALALGNFYFFGSGVPKDYKRARALFEKAGNEPLAQNNLGYIYEKGLGVPVDIGKALALYQQAADQGLPVGEESLADLYREGLGVQKDITLARQWYSKAARHGNLSAKKKLERLGGGLKKKAVGAHRLGLRDDTGAKG